MLKINITGENQVIFRNEKNENVFYTTSLSKKDVNGQWENGNILIKFPKDTEIENKAKINIKNAWLSFWKSQDKKTNVFIFCNEFEMSDGQAVKPDASAPSDGFYPIDESVNDDDLPF